MRRFTPLSILLPLLLLTPLLSGCDGGGLGRTQVWIDIPLDGTEIEAGTVPVQSHAASREGIARVELWVNGELYRSDDNPSPDEPVIYVIQPWIPTGPGEYHLEVRAYATDGTASEPAGVTVTVVGEAAEATMTPTAEFATPTPPPEPTEPSTPTPATLTPTPPLPTITPTPLPPTPPFTPTPEPYIAFWADADTVQAGSCTTIHWETSNVQAVFFDDQGVPGVGTHQTCPCSPETHTLDVLLQDGSHDVRTLTINVTGSCVTPTPTPDLTAPPVPEPLEPGNPDPDDVEGVNCPVTLRWSAVSDPSGVVYRVALETNSTGYWTPVNTWYPVHDTQLEVSGSYCQTGLIYRWRVQAEDGAGNQSGWSRWLHYGIPIP